MKKFILHIYIPKRKFSRFVVGDVNRFVLEKFVPILKMTRQRVVNIRTAKREHSVVRSHDCQIRKFISIAHWYGEAFAVECVGAPDNVREGYIYNMETGAFSAPPPHEPEPEPQDDLTMLAADVAEVKAAMSAFLEEAGIDE